MGEWLKEFKNDYLCECGTLLHNTYNSAISRHKESKKHINLINGRLAKRRGETCKKTKFQKIKTLIIFE